VLAQLTLRTVKYQASDFRLISTMNTAPLALYVRGDLPVNNVDELLALAKQSTAKDLSYGSTGPGSLYHLAGDSFRTAAGINTVHIPYRGTAPAVTDLIGGQIQLVFTGAPAVLGHIKSGQLHALAVSSPKRLEAMPNLPTVAESGYKNFEADQGYGVVAPAGTPKDIVQKLNMQINVALNSPELKKRLSAEGAIAAPESPEAFGKLIAHEIARWQPVISSGRVKAD